MKIDFVKTCMYIYTLIVLIFAQDLRRINFRADELREIGLFSRIRVCENIKNMVFLVKDV